jgi:serine/threonine-protein kinase
MNEPHDPNRTVDIPSAPADALDAGLAAGFGRAESPRSSLGDMRPVLLKEAEGDSAHVVKPHSDAMPPPEQTGNRYQLSGEIARGGMGAVLRGRDVDLGRDLAVKVLLEKHVTRPEVARRFIEEAQIGGQLQHPGVVPVYDIGRFGDRPFFTMKLVKGQTLARLLADRASYAQDRPRLLDIALRVAQTLAYAHAKGVIHRDLKPANVMVGAFGEVQVMDWGLAKVLAEGGIADEEKASRGRQPPEDVTQIRTARSSGSTGSFGTVTEAGSLLGTPAYMPPEQANGDVANLDRRADVFGLGAILCEILTGKPPYVGRSTEQVRRKACNGDLADALARLGGCGADQELVVLTRACLAPEAIDRPKDAQAVADRLTAYLDGVQARLHKAKVAEVAARAKAIEEAKRRRLTLALAATVLLALTLGGGGWLWVKNEHDARQTQLVRDVNDALNKATALREKAKSATTGGAALFAQAREQAQRALALVDNGPADATLVDQVRRLQSELDEEEKDRQLIAALDEARLAQAETLAGENRFASDRAVPRFRAAFEDYGLPAGQGEPKAAAQRIGQRPPAVREAIAVALDEWDALAGDPKHPIEEPHRDWLRAVLETVEPAQGWTRRFRAARDEKDEGKRKSALEKLAQEEDAGALPVRALTRLAGQLDKVEAYAAAAQLLRRAQRRRPDDFWVNHNLGEVLQKLTPPELDESVRFLTAAAALRPNSPGAQVNLGYALEKSGKVDEAIACCKKAIALDPKYAAAHANLGVTLWEDKRDYDAAIVCFRTAIALEPKFAGAHYNLGHALLDRGNVDEAIDCYKEAIASDPKYSRAHNSLGNALARNGQVDEAIVCWRKAVELDPKLAAVHSNLGAALAGKGRVDEAIDCFKKAIASDPKNVEAHNNLGQALKGKGQVNEAIDWFRKAIAIDPKHAKIHTNLGNALAPRGQVDEAIDSYRKALALDPKYAAAHDGLGIALCSKGQVEEAITCFQKAIELAPKDASAYSNLGEVLRRQGKVDEAIACFQKALARDPKYAAALNGLGAILCDIKRDYDGAITCFRKAIESDPKIAVSHNNLGNALRAKGQLDEAIACYQKAIALDPKYARARWTLGNALKDKGQWDEAIDCWRKAIELDPKYADAHNHLGVALKERGQLDEAIGCFKKAIEIDPKDAKANSNLGNALLAKGHVDEAIAWCKKAVALDPNYAPAHNNLGVALKAKGQEDEAIACYKKAIALDPRYAAAHASLGVALLAKGQVDEAIAYYRKAIALDPRNANTHNSLGNALGAKGQVEEAIACYKKAIALDPKDGVTHYNLGNALADKGKVEEAIACYRRAIALHPNLAEAHCNLGHRLQRQGQFIESLAALQRGHELGTKRPGWPYPSAAWVRQAERLAALEAKLPAVLKGELTPVDTGEYLVLVAVCKARKLHHAATRLYADAFAADPKLPDDLKTGHRYNAACHAALAAAGQGEDAGKLDDKERARLRKKALDWLRADLALRTKQLESGNPADRAEVQRVLKHWHQDSDLADLRDADALTKLPAEERTACDRLWADVAALLKKAQP